MVHEITTLYGNFSNRIPYMHVNNLEWIFDVKLDQHSALIRTSRRLGFDDVVEFDGRQYQMQNDEKKSNSTCKTKIGSFTTIRR